MNYPKKIVGLLIVLVACNSPTTPPDGKVDLIPSIELIELRDLQLTFDFQCVYHGMWPKHTFTANIDPDTLEVAYDLTAVAGSWPIRNPTVVGTFTDTLTVSWHGSTGLDPRELRVEFVLSYEKWRVAGVTRCRV